MSPLPTQQADLTDDYNGNVFVQPCVKAGVKNLYQQILQRILILQYKQCWSYIRQWSYKIV